MDSEEVAAHLGASFLSDSSSSSPRPNATGKPPSTLAPHASPENDNDATAAAAAAASAASKRASAQPDADHVPVNGAALANGEGW